MASEVPMLSRIGMRSTPTSTGTRRNAPPAPMSPATKPTDPQRAITVTRLKATVARSSPAGGSAGEMNISGRAIVVMRAKMARSARPDTRDDRSAPSRDPTAIAGPPVRARPRCTSACRP